VLERVLSLPCTAGPPRLARGGDRHAERPAGLAEVAAFVDLMRAFVARHPELFEPL
jgi:hypothetical protein